MFFFLFEDTNEAIVLWGGGHCPFHEYMQEICTYPSTITFSGPFQRNWKHGMKHGKIVRKQLYLFTPLQICIVLRGQYHILQLAPPPTTPKRICRYLQDFPRVLFLFEVEERNHAVKHGVKLLGTALPFQKHANMHSLWGSTSLITITTPPTTSILGEGTMR